MTDTRPVIDLANSLQPRITFASDTTFGHRVRQEEESKRLVGSYIAIEMLHTGQEVFIADGTSGYWLALAVFELDLNITVHTNNSAIMHEKDLRPKSAAEVFGAPGKLHSEYMGVFGNETTAFCERAAKHSHLSILPVSHLSYEKGPYARDKYTRAIKSAVVSTSPQLVLIADATKVGQQQKAINDQVPPIFTGGRRRIWQNVRDSGNLIVVCNRPSDLDGSFAYEASLFRDNQNVDLREITP